MRAGDGMSKERRHVAQGWYSDHQIIAEKPGCNYQGTKSDHGRALPCRFCSWRTGVEEHVVEVQWNTRKRSFSTSLSSPPGPKETELAALVRPAPGSRKSPAAIGGGLPQEE